MGQVGLAVVGRHERNERADTITMEAARIISFFSVQPWTKKGQLKQPTDLFLLPHEQGLIQSKEKADQVKQRVEKFRGIFDKLRSVKSGQATSLSSNSEVNLIVPNRNA